MKKVRITVMRKVCHHDLMEKYENPIEDACGMEEGRVFIADGWRRPEGLCESAWDTMSPSILRFIMNTASRIAITLASASASVSASTFSL